MVAQWSRDPRVNTLVTGANRNQTVPKIISDGSSGSITIWQDARDSATNGIDLYAQHVNSRGIIQWTANGVIISKSSGNQISPAIVGDGRGGAIIVWQDGRNGNSDIYAQHISADSSKLWTLNGTPVCTEIHEQTNPVIVSDNLGGGIIVWQDYRSGNADLYAQHIDAGGGMTWASNGISVVTALNDQIQPAIVGDNNNGAIVAWQDLRNATDFDIYIQRITSTGTLLWGTNGLAISTAANHQRYPAVASDGAGGAFLAWEDYQNENAEIYLQHVHSDQTMGFALNGIEVYSSVYDQTQPKIVSDGAGGAIVSWIDMRAGDKDVFAQRVSSGDAFLWTSDGIPACSAIGNQQNLDIVTDGSNGAIVTWEDYRNGLPDIFAQRILSNGSILWQIDGVGISTDSTAQSMPVIVDNGVHGAIIAWQDARKLSTRGYDIYTQLINDVGTLGGFSIHGTVYNDTNQNGGLDGGEVGLSGWKINLSGVTNKSLQTDASGNYSFDGLAPGIYIVKPEIKSGWIQTQFPDTIVNLSIGGDSVRNYGVFQIATISGIAFNDKNHDGLLGSGERGDTVRTLRLTGQANVTTTCDTNGLFTFIGLQLGTYYLNEDPHPGWIQTSQPLVDTIVIDTSGVDKSGYLFGNFQMGKINGKVYNDYAGDSAIVSGTKPNIKTDTAVAGWDVKLYKGNILIADSLTNSSGAYTFTNIDTGMYVVKESLTVGWIQTYPKPPGDTLLFGGGRAYKVRIDTSKTNIGSCDFANFLLGTVTGKEIKDIARDSDIVGDPALSGWEIKLFKNGILMDSRVTDSIGAYKFTGLLAGAYTVEESLFNDWWQTYPRIDTSLSSTLFGPFAGPRAVKVSIVSRKIATVNFGNFQLGTIRGHVLLDVANDSIVLGDPPIPHWHVRLRGPAIKDTTTGGSGDYAFSRLDAGTYVVEAIGIIGAVPTYPRVSFPNVFVDTGRRAYRVTIDSSGEIDDGVDFGISTSLISGTTFNDINGDGIKGFGDSGQSNVMVRLSGRKTDSTLSDIHGNYVFAGLDTGSYQISEDAPPGWIKTFPKPNFLYSISLISNNSYLPNNDFGNFNMGVIGGTVYYDRDSNGQKNGGDMALANWKVYISGPTTDSAFTDAAGHYSFIGLPLGVYVVREQRVAGWIQTVPHDPDIVTIASGSIYQNVDFGNTGTGRISGTVYNDLDGNGVKGSSEPRLGNWRVYIQSIFGADSLVTDTTGGYLYPRLAPASYTLTEYLIPGWKRTAPSTGGSYVVSLAAGGNSQAKDFGNFALGTISGVVFNDANGNGVQDGGEPGILNSVIYMSGSRNDSMVTDANGNYAFICLDTGKYVVKQRVLPFFVRTVPKSVDSYTDTIKSSAQFKIGRNFGIFTSTIISGTVFNDIDGNAIKDSGDPVLPGWKIHLVRVDGIVVADSVVESSENGLFQFTGVSLGRYIVTEEIKTGWYQTLPVVQETIIVSNLGQQIVNKNIGNYYCLMTGTVFEDLNGDGTKAVGEPGRVGSRLYLVKNGFVVDSTVSGVQGSYSFAGRGHGSYIITQAVETGYAQTVTPPTIVNNQPSGVVFSNLNFGNFKRFSLSGITFEDVNRNGIRDAGEAGLIQCILVLLKDGVVLTTDTSLADGSYIFDNLGPGNYCLTQPSRTGYLKSYPLSPDTVKFAGQSGLTVSGKNFGNYLNLSRSITIRMFTDGDGIFTTSNDLLPKGWSMGLYSGTTLLKSTTAASLDTSNLPVGTYIVQIADSTGSGWQSLGERHTIHQSPGPDSIIVVNSAVFTDTVILHTGECHILDFVSVKYARMVFRSFADLDGNTSTSSDQSGMVRNIELYTNFVAPGNLVFSGTDSLLTNSNIGSGVFLARQVPVPDWQTIGRRINRKYRVSADDTLQITVNPGDADTIDFVNTAAGTIIARNRRDEDGDTTTTGDRFFTKWNLVIYKDTIMTSKKVDSVYAESLVVHPLVGNYIVRQVRSNQWKTISLSLDSTPIGPRDTVHVAVTGGDIHIVDFLNSASGKTKTWAGSIDAAWDNHLNWSPQVLPTSGDSIIINSDRPWRVPRVPPHLLCSSLIVNNGAGLLPPLLDSMFVNGSVVNNGLINVDPTGTPVIVINGDFGGAGTFTPGYSTLLVRTGIPRMINGGQYYNLQIGDSSSGTTTSTMTGNGQINGNLILNNNLDAGNNTLFIAIDSSNAVQGSGSIVSGTVLRTIHSGSTQNYRFKDDSTYIQFNPGGQIPQTVSMRFVDTAALNFGSTWDSVGIQVDTVGNTSTVQNISSLPLSLPYTFGGKVNGRWTPLLHHVYMIHAVPETGFVANIKLRYDPSDLPVGVSENSLVLLRLRLVTKVILDSMYSGWNIVSFPVYSGDYHTSFLYPMVSGNCYGYQTGVGYSVADMLTLGVGYWMKFPAGQQLSYCGIERTIDSVNVQAGWNLIGMISYPIRTDHISVTPTGNIQSAIFGYRQGYFKADTVWPGKAYWIKVGTAGKVVLNSYASGIGKLAADILPPQLNTITIRDAANRNQVLYFGSASSVRTEHFEIPPLPPDGIFDVRFAGNHSVVIYPASGEGSHDYQIQMQGVAYPVTIEWQLHDPVRREISLQQISDIAGERLTLSTSGKIRIESPDVKELHLTIDPAKPLPTAFALRQCYPNPFNPSTRIDFDLPEASEVTLKVYDMLGREVTTVFENASYEAGTQSAIFNASRYASGVYFYRIMIHSPHSYFQDVKKMMLLR
jgi:hypothetical protein